MFGVVVGGVGGVGVERVGYDGWEGGWGRHEKLDGEAWRTRDVTNGRMSNPGA